MVNTSLRLITVCLFVLLTLPLRHAAAQDWLMSDDNNPLNVHIQNLNPVKAMTGVTAWVDFVPDGWSITPDSVNLDTIAPSSTKIANFTVTVPSDIAPGTLDKIRLRLTDDQGNVWTAVEKSALEIEVAIAGVEGFIKTYSGGGDDYAVSIEQTDDGGYIVAGHTNSFNKGQASDDDIWIVKLDEAGEISWQLIYGGEGNERDVSIRQTGSYVLTAASFDTLRNAGLLSFYLSSLQTIMGGKTYYSKELFIKDAQFCTNGEHTQQVLQAAEFTPTGYIVAGTTSSFEPVGQNIWLLKLSNSGASLWQKTYGADDDEQADSIQTTNDGGYIVTGTVGSYAADKSAWVFKLQPDSTNLNPENPTPTSDGFIEWETVSLDPNGISSRLHTVRETSYGGYIAAGSTESAGAGQGDLWVVKLSSSGSAVWQKTYGGPEWDGAVDIRQTTDGGYIVAGITESFGVGVGWREQDAWILKLDRNGNIGESYPGTWQKTYGKPDWDGVGAIRRTDDGGYIMSGELCVRPTSGGLCTATQNGWFLKLDRQGNREWEHAFGGNTYMPLPDVRQTLDSGYVSISGYRKISIIKTDKDGDTPCFAESVASTRTETTITGIGANVGFSSPGVFTLGQATSIRQKDISSRLVTIGAVCDLSESLAERAPEPGLVAYAISENLNDETFEDIPFALESFEAFQEEGLDTETPSTVPEPATFLIFLIGLLSVGMLVRQQKRKEKTK